MNLAQVLSTIEKKYKKEVKPAIEEGRFGFAYAEMNNIVYLMEKNWELIMPYVHMGVAYIASARVLRDSLKDASLKDATELPKKDIRWFEACAAQTKLPQGPA